MAEQNKNETPEERFKRIASQRTNDVLERLRILGNCSNRQTYAYNEKDVKAIFAAIEKKVREVRQQFSIKKEKEFKL